MAEQDESRAETPFTDEQIREINTLLADGGGVSCDQIANVIGYTRRTILPEHGTEVLEWYLLTEIAAGRVRRVWNSEQGDHFYMLKD